MKKIFNLALTSVAIFSVVSCSSPTSNNSGNNSNNTNPSISPSPNTGAGVSGDVFASRASFLAFAECVKTKFPETAGPVQGYINQVNAMPDSQWASVAVQYRAIANPYLSRGCN